MDTCCIWTYVGIAALCLILYALRKYFLGPKCQSKARLDGKTVIITGANTGIGKETAIDLAKRGAIVVLACRDQKRGEAALDEIKERSGSSKIVLKLLDLASLVSIKEFAESFLKEYAALHILINNAGVMWCPYMKTKDGFEMQIGVNHFGHFALTNLLLERLKESAPSRIVNLSSMGHLMGTMNFDDINSQKSYSSYGAYYQSKLANILFTKEIHRKLVDTGVTAYAVHPGGVDTELSRHIGLIKVFVTLAGKYMFLKTPEYGAQTSIYCAVEEGLEKRSGNYFQDCHEQESNKESYDEGIAKKLWEVSEDLTKVKFPF
ncbi:retinol dehydrogenase 11-like [Hydractinia symbiolongicarpus]|uniref:retinol dehydrogenase 11-like n=1 Tax=Hydractinia symbiolongicarpus TaxID=13093 RepID=UPI00254B1EC7|nr:retinol dehydrogenase 11-like [Hydractinia symbiolongicarpus]